MIIMVYIAVDCSKKALFTRWSSMKMCMVSCWVDEEIVQKKKETGMKWGAIIEHFFKLRDQKHEMTANVIEMERKLSKVSTHLNQAYARIQELETRDRNGE